MQVEEELMYFVRTAAGLLPSTDMRLVELNQRSQYVPLCLSELLFGGQPLALRIEHLQVAADAAHVTHVCQAALVAQRLGEKPLAAGVLLGLLVANQRIGDFAKGFV